MKTQRREEKGSIELIVLGLLAALIVVLAIPLLTQIGSGTKGQLETMKNGIVSTVGT